MRASMAGIIQAVRLLIGDPASDDEQFSDNDLQALTTAHRLDVYYLALTPLPSVAPGGAVSYLEWVADFPGLQWATDAVLTDGAYNVLTPAASDWERGRWTFAATQTAVLLKGSAYDTAGIAADACEAWIARLKGAYDFSADGASYQRSQQVAALQVLVQRLRGRSAHGALAAKLVQG